MDNPDWESVAALILDEVIKEKDGGHFLIGSAASMLAKVFGIDYTKSENHDDWVLLGTFVFEYMEEVHGIAQNDPRMETDEGLGTACFGFEIVPLEENDDFELEDAGQQQPPPNGSNDNDNPSQGSDDEHQDEGNYQGHGYNEDFFPGGYANYQEDSEPESDSLVSLIVENLKKEEVLVDILSENFKGPEKLPDSSNYETEVHCTRNINPENSIFKVMSIKVETRLRELKGGIWPGSEAQKSVTSKIKPCYPSSSAKTNDWDIVEEEIKKQEEKEPDDDVNSLLVKIYNSGDENAKRAMIKSMQESNGTLLSSNWEEGGQKQVEVPPPYGMEDKTTFGTANHILLIEVI